VAPPLEGDVNNRPNDYQRHPASRPERKRVHRRTPSLKLVHVTGDCGHSVPKRNPLYL
jgi:hypothetical protein